MRIFKRIIIFSMLLSFLTVGISGVVRVPNIRRYFTFVYNFIPASNLAFIHDWSGVALVFLIIIHLILKREWFKKFFSGSRQIPPEILKILYAVIVIFLIGSGVYYISDKIKGRGTINLSGVEITEYQGEKLGSINDFRENSIKGPQYVDRNEYRLQITGLVDQPAEYSYDELLRLQFYQKVVKLNCVEGWSVKGLWKGFLVKDLLKNAAIKPEAKTVIFYAYDGYSTSFPLDYIMGNDIIMAHTLNGVELPPERGFPFQLVAEQKWGYKWIKWITKIELSDNTEYKGFWESRGYNNSGDLNGPKFER